MNWLPFQTYGESANKAFEAMCNQLFHHWCQRQLETTACSFHVVNGDGGDGGVEAFVKIDNHKEWAIQAKWFPDGIDNKKLKQVKSSLSTACKVHPELEKYIVCIPRSLTGDKVVKNDKVASNTEWNLWKAFVDQAFTDFPNVEIVLWDDNELLNQLQFADCFGIYDFWFNSSHISEETIQTAIDLQMNSWLKPKYIPELHVNGMIKDRLDCLIGSVNVRRELISKTDKYIGHCISLQQILSVLLPDPSFCGIGDNVQSKLKIIAEDLSIVLSTLKNVKDHLFLDLQMDPIALLPQIDWNAYLAAISELKKSKYNGNGYFNRTDLQKNLEAIYNIQWEYFETEVWNALNYNRVVIAGNQGTGKTHAIADYVSQCTPNVIPVLIRAKDIPTTYTWGEAICHALRLSKNQDEVMIWNSLEALAWRRDRDLPSEDIHQKCKVLICIDGIDEIKPYEGWINRIRETESIIKKYGRIHFCFTGRPYAFDGYQEEQLYRIPIYGDVAVQKIYDRYLRYYDIDAVGFPMLKWMITTPFALNLFCLTYQGQQLKHIDYSTTVLTKLIECYIAKLDNEFAVSHNLNADDRWLSKILLILLDVFSGVDEIDRCIIIERINTGISGRLSNTEIGCLLDFLEHHGIVYSYNQIMENELFGIPHKIYTVGIQPFFDYLLAKKAVLSNLNDSDDLQPKDIQLNETARKMYSLILLEDKGILEGEAYYDAKHEVMDDTLEYACFALSNASPQCVASHVNYIREIMTLNAAYFHRITNSVVLPVCRRDDHPLGASFFHDVCMRFSSPIERDMIWSTPGHLRSIEGENFWNHLDDVNIKDEEYLLTKEDCVWGLPIIYVWLLSALDQRVRVYARRSLAAWGTMVPTEFTTLFVAGMSSSDPQMRTDLSAIAMSVGCNPKCPAEVLKKLAMWFSRNVFKKTADRFLLSSSVRHYGRCVVECAFSRSLISKTAVDRCCPPYERSKPFLMLDGQELNERRLGQDSPFGYDISRYVLNDPITHMFFGPGFPQQTDDCSLLTDHYSLDELQALLDKPHLSRKATREIKKAIEVLKERYKAFEYYHALMFGESDVLDIEVPEDVQSAEKTPSEMLLERYAERYRKDGISPHQFIHAAAMHFFVEMGWDDCSLSSQFDGAVRGTYYKATHGSQSTVMSISEKYAWEAKYYIIGYLADTLPLTDYGRTGEYVSDYIITDNYANPIQEHIYASKKNDAEVLIPSPAFSWCEVETTDVSIREYLKTNAVPFNPSDWGVTSVNNDKDLCVLRRYYSIDDGGISNNIWLSACLIKNTDMAAFRSELSHPRNSFIEFFHDPSSIGACIDCNCYVTPLELCWMPWRPEVESLSSQIACPGKSFRPYEIHKAVTTCISGFVDEQSRRYDQENSVEVRYYTPSRIIRDNLNITSYDGTFWFDAGDNVIGIYTQTGKGWDLSQQILAVNKDKMDRFLQEKGYTLIWVVRLLQEADIKTRERLNINDQRDRVWLVEQTKRDRKVYLLYDHYD